MATHPQSQGGPSGLPLSAALSIIPSLPRPLLSRLVTRAIERLDEIDGEPDLEDDDPLEVAWPESGCWRLAASILNEDDENDDPLEPEDAL